MTGYDLKSDSGKTKLKERLLEYRKKDVMLAFSGGVDSSLLLKLLCDQANADNTAVYAVTIHTMLHPGKETEDAVAQAREMGAVPIVIRVDELQEAGISNNPPDRCYLCKRHMFGKIAEIARQKNAYAVIEGTNADDLTEYRPGIRALKELGIHSPLADADLTKEEVRALAAEYGIQTADKPSSPCMATRFPYGTALSYEKIHRAEKAEVYLRQKGYYNVRARIHDDVLRIEVDKDSMGRLLSESDEVAQEMRQIGYAYVTLDLEGFRSGSFDRQ